SPFTQMLAQRTASFLGAPAATRLLLEVGEEELDLAGGRLGRVGAVHEVLADLQGVVATEGTGSGLDRVGHAHEGADRLDGAGTVDGQRDQRTAGDEVDQLAEEGALAVLAVVLLGGRAVDGPELGGGQR